MYDYVESLFQGVDILIDKRLEEVSYDKTIICTITDNSDGKNGKYRVSDGSATYIAYSDLDDYRNGDQVRVSIPMGDFSQKKFIVGKYAQDNDVAPITYRSAIDTIVNVSGNLTKVLGDKTFGIVANGDTPSIILWNQSLSDKRFGDLQKNDIYNTIVLKADFKTLFNNQNIISGTYGLRIDLMVRPSVNSPTKMRRSIELSSEEMFGNPYNFTLYSTQSKSFNISSTGIIEGIELSLFQKNNFEVDKKGHLTYPQGQPVPDNIIVKNIEIGFGSDILKVDDNVVQIYSDDGLFYNYDPHSEKTNLKKIGLMWYNKDDNNKYLGFSDGIYNPNYDELEYIQESSADANLMAQKGRENIPTDEQSLKLAANIETSKPIIQKAIDLVGEDLNTLLQQFNRSLTGAVEAQNLISNALKKTGSGSSNDLESMVLDLQQKLSGEVTEDGKITSWGLSQQYSQALKYGYQVQKNFDKDDRIQWPTAAMENEKNYYSQIKRTLTSDSDSSVDKFIGNLLTSVQNKITSKYPGYQGLFDSYELRLNRLKNDIKNSLEKLPDDIDNDFKKLQGYRDKSSYTPYKEQDFSAYDNQYCIYWYRYEKDYEDPSGLLPAGWKRLTSEELAGPANNNGINVGLSDVYIDEDGNKVLNENGQPVHAPRPELETGYFSYYMNNEAKEEKFKAVVFYNHNMYVSNELVFTNSQEIPDKTTLDKTDILMFEHLQNSSKEYYLYNETMKLTNIADGSKSRQIRCHYDGLLAKDEALENAGLYWYVPLENSMLVFDKLDLENRGFDNDLDAVEKPSYHRPGYACFYKKITVSKDRDNNITDFKDSKDLDSRDFWYKINGNYDRGYTKNEIICEVKFLGKQDPISSKEFFVFGISGTHGTHYTLDLVPRQNEEARFKNQQLILDVVLKDYNNNSIPVYYGNVELKNENLQGNSFNAVWYFNDATDIAINGTSQYLTAITASDKAVKGLTMAASNGEWSGILQISTQLKLPEEEESKSRFVNLDQLHAIAYSKKTSYYATGPTYIIYNNYGTIDDMSIFNGSYKLFEQGSIGADGKYENDKQIIDINWSIEYYIIGSEGRAELVNPNASGIPETTKKKYEFYMNYMPKLNADNCLIPATLWLDNLDCFAVVVAKSKSDNSVLWKQPIIINQSRYSSTMLNNWDGSFKIDEDSGTIMSTMLGAGRKTAQNTFEGVLMGNVGAGAGIDNAGLGIYGFNDGAQSFGLNIDGTAFFGKAGKGRILFDGNSGSISSAAFNEAGVGMKIDLDDGYLEMKGTEGSLEDGYTEGTNSLIRLDVKSPYVKLNSADGNTLLFLGDNDQYLKSNNYVSGSSGMKIDLDDGIIDAYELKITSNHIKLDSTENADPYFAIKHNDSTYIAYFGVDNYYLQSATYPNGSGLFLDLKNGKIDGTKFTLTANGSNDIVLDSEATGSQSVFYAGKSDGDYIDFKASGSLSMQASDFTLQTSDQSIYLSNSGENFSDICGESVNNVVLKAGENFGVTNNGVLYAHNANLSGTITGSSIRGGSIQIGTYQVEGDPNTYIKFSVDENGNVFAKKGYFEGTLYADSGYFMGTVWAAELITGTTNADKSKITDIKCQIDSAGKLWAKEAEIEGTIYASDGTFTGSISSSSIRGGSIKIGTYQIEGDPATYIKFSVDENGDLFAKNGYFEGRIYAESGQFTGTIWAAELVTGTTNADKSSITDVKCKIDSSGKLWAKEAEITGKLTAGVNSDIGGWSVKTKTSKDGYKYTVLQNSNLTLGYHEVSLPGGTTYNSHIAFYDGTRNWAGVSETIWVWVDTSGKGDLSVAARQKWTIVSGIIVGMGT